MQVTQEYVIKISRPEVRDVLVQMLTDEILWFDDPEVVEELKNILHDDLKHQK